MSFEPTGRVPPGWEDGKNPKCDCCDMPADLAYGKDPTKEDPEKHPFHNYCFECFEQRIPDRSFVKDAMEAIAKTIEDQGKH